MTTSFPAPIFLIGTIQIKSVEGASCINFGNNYPTHFQSHKKQNQGFGTVSGDHSQIFGTKAKLDHAGSFELRNPERKEFPKSINKIRDKSHFSNTKK